MLPSFSELARAARAIWSVNVKTWKIEMRYPLSLLFFAVEPVIWLVPILLFGYAVVGGRTSEVLAKEVGIPDFFSYAIIGYSIGTLLSGILWSTSMAVRRESWEGTFESVMVTPAPRFCIVAGNVLHSLGHVGSAIVIQMLVAIAFLGVKVSPLGAVAGAVVLLLTLLAVLGIGLVFTGIVLVTKRGWIVIEGLDWLLLITAPLSYPVTVLPPTLRIVSQANPVSIGVESIRSMLLFGPELQVLLEAVGKLALMLAATLSVGYASFLVTEKMLRKRGELDKY